MNGHETCTSCIKVAVEDGINTRAKLFAESDRDPLVDAAIFDAVEEGLVRYQSGCCLRVDDKHTPRCVLEVV